MKILLLNNRDIRHPESGGAEVYTQKVLERLADYGHEIQMISHRFSGSKRSENLNGITIRRIGTKLSVYPKVAYKIIKSDYSDYDIIIDEYTYMPFLTPTYCSLPIVLLCHELAREKYFYELQSPISQIMYHLVEPAVIQSYSNSSCIAVSESTKSDLEKFGCQNVSIVRGGTEHQSLTSVPEKSDNLQLLFVGVIKELNKVEDAIEAFERVKRRKPDAELYIAGNGPKLEKISQLESDSIHVLGYVSEQKKIELMKNSHLILVPAVREGWGLVVTEANSLGTPAIGYDVPGLRDSIKHGQTGLLCQNPIDMADSILEIISNEKEYRQLCEDALEFSREFSWDKSAREFEEVLINAKK